MNIYEALSAVQTKLKAPKGNYNSFGKYKYRSAEDIIEAVKPLCKEHGLLLLMQDEITETAGRVYVKATASVIQTQDEGGGKLSVSAYAREAEKKTGMDESQITGTASSYARKYALNGLFAIDDTKDADTDEYAKQTLQTSAKPLAACSECKKTIKGDSKYSAEEIAEKSLATYGRALCLECAKKEAKKKNVQ